MCRQYFKSLISLFFIALLLALPEKASAAKKERTYQGAPPVIPHEVSLDEKKLDCLSCHLDGGYSARFKAYAPPSPHPTYSQCLQCHVPQKTDKLFAENEFLSGQAPGNTPTMPEPQLSQLLSRKTSLSFLENSSTTPWTSAIHPTEKPLEIVDRIPQIKRFPCSNCHIPGLSEKDIEHIQSPHTHIWKNHGNLKTMNCYICHNSENRDLLNSPIDGKTASFNQAPQLCYSCHSTQYKDWLSGAHGKRIGSWKKEPRTILSCTQCHNPHNPEFPKQHPKASRKTKKDH